jgi:hypothetical protein
MLAACGRVRARNGETGIRIVGGRREKRMPFAGEQGDFALGR